MANIKYEIHRDLGALSDWQVWKKHVRVVSWNGAAPKIDIRTWNTETNQPAKGIALSDDEARRLYEILRDYFAEKDKEDA